MNTAVRIASSCIKRRVSREPFRRCSAWIESYLRQRHVPESHDAEEGFSLLEVLIAVVVLSTTAAGLAGLFTIAAVSTRMARSQTLAMLLASDKLEQLRGLTWSFDASGAPVSDTTSDVSTQPMTNVGQGLRASPPDSLQRNTAGCVDYLDQTGRWVGTGPQPVTERSTSGAGTSSHCRMTRQIRWSSRCS